MKAFIIIIISVVMAALMLCASIKDFKANKTFIASLQFVVAMMWISSAVCAMCYIGLHTIN